MQRSSDRLHKCVERSYMQFNKGKCMNNPMQLRTEWLETVCRKAAGVLVDNKMNTSHQGVLAARKAIAYKAVLTRVEIARSPYLAILRTNLEYYIQFLVPSRKHILKKIGYLETLWNLCFCRYSKWD